MQPRERPTLFIGLLVLGGCFALFFAAGVHGATTSKNAFRALLARPDTVEYYEPGARAGQVAFLAPHGGLIEPGTEELARTLAGATGSALYVLSYRGTPGDAERFHLSSAAYDPADSPALARCLAASDTAIALHGYEGPARVIVGGRNTKFAATIAKRLQQALAPDYEVVWGNKAPRKLAGTARHNIVNRFRLAGVQIELPHRFREQVLAARRRHSDPAALRDVERFTQAIEASVAEWCGEHATTPHTGTQLP